MRAPIRRRRNRLIGVLTRRRRQLGLSQRTLGRQIGVPFQLLGEWERGDVTPNLGSFLRWTEALDCDVEISVATP